MPCQHAMKSESKGVDRREFMKAALAIGGSSAFVAAQARADAGASGTTDSSELPNRQYAWNEYCAINDGTGLAKTPQHHLQFMLDYKKDGVPTDADRQQIEDALQTLEEAYEWSNQGVLFTLGYSPTYFDRFDENLPDGTGLDRPERIIEETDIAHSGDVAADHYDAHMHLASDNAAVLLEAEQALFGYADQINGVSVDATFDGVFAKMDRRTGFIGNPHEQWDEEIPGDNPIGENAPVWFGFKSLYTDSQPSEDHVAIEDETHPFYDGTTEQVSLLGDHGVREWYDQNDHEERAQRMFTPEHTSEDTGPHARELNPTSGTENRRDDGETMVEIAERTEQDAEEKGVVGHAQKLARARDPKPPILRRDFPSTDTQQPHTQFISNQRTIQDFINVRKAMSFVYPDSDQPAESEVPLKDHGIQGYLQVESRGAFLVPPRNLRALPLAQP